ncbi:MULTISPECIES: hypothetical protein [unclassified Nonomuraea]|uniref:hypothetical protein n=1 Tax=unclassified Nonomuraea TaxID=2593643 RepID=UPI001378F3BD|nr:MULTISPECIES: hypothetical protein [unclassified Nonomuraea]NBE91971.1 hypothetical protein [Nonomuraea sp. K271]
MTKNASGDQVPLYPDESGVLHATFSRVPLDDGEADLPLLGLGTFRGLSLNA